MEEYLVSSVPISLYIYIRPIKIKTIVYAYEAVVREQSGRQLYVTYPETSQAAAELDANNWIQKNVLGITTLP